MKGLKQDCVAWSRGILACLTNAENLLEMSDAKIRLPKQAFHYFFSDGRKYGLRSEQFLYKLVQTTFFIISELCSNKQIL